MGAGRGAALALLCAAVLAQGRRLSPGERREAQREVLAVLGLPGRPRPRAAPRAAAPLFMLDLYRAAAEGEEGDGEGGGSVLGTRSSAPGTAASRADTVVSLVNLVERDRDIFSPKPYWKEFRFDLTQAPTGEVVTAAEFRIYKARGVPRYANNTLHVSIYEVAAEHSNRESDLFLLDVQDLRAGMEGWLVFDVTAASSHWLVDRKYNLGLRLYVETDDGLSVDPGLAGLLGLRGPRSKQPFMVTFFRASPGPVRVTRAAKPPRRRQPKKTNDLPHPNKLPGIFGLGDRTPRLLSLLLRGGVRLPPGFLHECYQPRHPAVPGPPDEA
ncbi:bone morphogenetic protein 8A isoform X2 [Cuculus canorus]|uniref:bone morphogenetic protein 8A isoform X2 n=1 Tax=Cuculus canorus TaxID=55661 RepID=UPI0023AAF0F9|nr:bone morphogenetic protein 8A isoform X2 [Cuculus canorus]